MHPSTTGLVQPIEDALEKPYSMPPNATVESAMDGTSRCGRFPSPTLSSKKHGTGKRSKGQRLDAAQACAPPVRVDDGPAHDGPDRGTCRHHDAGHAHGGSALLHGNTSMGTTDTNGSSTPDAAASHASADQQEKRRGSCAKRRSRGKRPRCGEEQLTGGETVDRKAETGTMMPLTRGYIDMIHCAVEASMAKSAMMTGRAGDMTV